MFFKTAPMENLSRDAKQEWHSRASRHGVTVPKWFPQLPNMAQVAGRATWLPGQVCRFGWGWPCYVGPVSCDAFP